MQYLKYQLNLIQIIFGELTSKFITNYNKSKNKTLIQKLKYNSENYM